MRVLGPRRHFRSRQEESELGEQLSLHHPPIWLASAAGCSELIQLILPSNLRGLTDPHFATGVEIWSRGSSAGPPLLTHQHARDSVLVKTDYESLLENAATSLEKARLLAVVHPDSGAWLNAFPISALGLRLDDSEVQIAIKLRLGLPMCSPHVSGVVQQWMREGCTVSAVVSAKVVTLAMLL